MKDRSNFDSAWKEALETYFSEFLQMLRPSTHARIDWTYPPKFLDKELQALLRNAAYGTRFVDKLVSVKLLDGKQTLLLIHIEIQTRLNPTFAMRMLDYHVRLKARYPGSRLLDMAVLTGRRRRGLDTAERGERLMSYTYKEENCGLKFTFPVMHLEWWRPRMQELQALARSNPFAVILMAQLEATATTRPGVRFVRKVELIRRFEQWGVRRDNRRMLFRVIDAMLFLPASLHELFYDTIEGIQKEHQMTYITSVERVQIERAKKMGRAEGIASGIAEGIAESLTAMIIAKFGKLPDWARARVNEADAATLKRWSIRILSAERIEDLFV